MEKHQLARKYQGTSIQQAVERIEFLQGEINRERNEVRTECFSRGKRPWLWDCEEGAGSQFSFALIDEEGTW